MTNARPDQEKQAEKKGLHVNNVRKKVEKCDIFQITFVRNAYDQVDTVPGRINCAISFQFHFTAIKNLIQTNQINAKTKKSEIVVCQQTF